MPRPSPRNCMSLPCTASVYRLLPSRSVHSSTCRRPSIYACRPFVRYFEAFSACLPQKVILNHVVTSCHSPALSRLRSLTATEKSQTAVPCGVYRSSGSRPKFPISVILLKDILFVLHL